MPCSIDEWKASIEKGNAKACRDAIAGASESERQSLASITEKTLRDLTRIEVQRQSQTESQRDEQRRQQEAARHAALATCSLSALKSVGWRIYPLDDAAIAVLADRKPKWLPDFAEHLLQGDSISWIPVRKLMRANLIPKPVHQNYVVGMTHLFGGVGGNFNSPDPSQRHKDWGVLAHLEAEPDLLDDIWGLFQVEGGGEYSLAAHDKFSGPPHCRWDGSLAELSRQGKLSRRRLLDESLSALDRGFAQFRAAWFSSFHELLQPTLVERRERLDSYLHLLGSPIPPTVSFALASIEVIDAADPIATAKLLAALPPMLNARGKGTVKAGVKLLKRIADRDPSAAPAVARIAIQALRHEASDVQAAALKLIFTAGDASDQVLLAELKDVSGVVAASNRKPIEQWLLADRAKPAAKARRESPKSDLAPTCQNLEPLPLKKNDDFEARISKLPPRLRKLAGAAEALTALRKGRIQTTALDFDGCEFSRLTDDRRIEPILDIEELIDVAAAVVEHPEDVDQAERMLDGVSRLCDQKPPNFEAKTGPLLKRLRDLQKRQHFIPFCGHDPAADFFGVLLAWLRQDYGTLTSVEEHGRPAFRYEFNGLEYSFPHPKRDHVGGFLATRARQLADRLKRRISVPALCAPTHFGGWIDPLVLVERANDPAILQNATDFEKVLALLRLAPDRRTQDRKRLTADKSEFLDAVRYALGADVAKRGPSSWLWAAAARARSPFATDPIVKDLGPDTKRAAQARPEVTIVRHQSYKWPRLKLVIDPPVPDEIDPRLVNALFWKLSTSHQEAEFESIAAVRQLIQVCPLNQEPTFANGVIAIGNNLDWGEANWQNREYLQPLLDPDVPLKPMALLLVAVGLAAKEPGEQGLATDVAIAAIDDGRLDGSRLGSVLAELLPTGLIKAARWAKSLEQIGRVSDLHAAVVQVAIETSLRGDPAGMPRDLHALVDLLKELVIAARSSVTDDVRQFLQSVGTSGKIKKAARVILDFDTPGDPQRAESIQRHVVESRIRRAERWAANE